MSDFVKNVNVDVEGRIVYRSGTIRYVKSGAEHQMHVTYDFAGVSEKDLLELASRTVHIAYQGMCRKDRDLKLTRDFDVLEWLTSERKGGGFKPTVSGLAKMSQKLSAEDRAKLLAMLTADAGDADAASDESDEAEANDESDNDADE